MSEDKPTKIRPELMKFVEAMELELQRHDAKKGRSWKKIGLFELEARIRRAAEYVENEGQDVDVANLCMMHFDNERRCHDRRKG